MNITRPLKLLAVPKNLWLAIFFYTLACGVFAQLVLVTYIVPSWNNRFGLLRDLDGNKFHHLALQDAKNITEGGWGNWDPLPDGQLVSGVASIFYVLIYPMPWSVLPLNATLWATSGVAFFHLIRLSIDDARKSLVAALPFILFPSSLLWTTQLSNEIYVIPAVVFVCLGWAIIVRTAQASHPVRTISVAGSLGLIALGSLLLLVTRGYLLRAITALFVIAALALTLHWIVQYLSGGTALRKLFASLVLFSLTSALMISISLLDAQEKPDKVMIESYNELGQETVVEWMATPWLPSFVDKQLESISKNRLEFIR